MKLFISSISNSVTPTPPDPPVISTYYVRQFTSGGYGDGSGIDYDNAFNGEDNIDWSLLTNKNLSSIGFADGSITNLGTNTTIFYQPETGGIGVMILENSFKVI